MRSIRSRVQPGGVSHALWFAALLAADAATGEQGKAPEQIVATKYVDDDPGKAVQSTRPLCPYPQTARWDGKGDVKDAKSFSCR